MPIKIPIYHQQTAPNALLNVNASVAQQHDYVGEAMGRVGAAGVRMATAINDQQTDDAIASAGSHLAEAHVWWREHAEKIKETYADNPSGYAEKLRTDFNTWRQDTEKTQDNNPHAKEFLKRGYDRLYVSVYDRARSYEDAAAVTFKDRKLQESAQLFSSLVTRGEISYSEAKESLDYMVANLGYDPASRNERAVKYRSLLAEQHLQHQITVDPATAKKAIERQYHGGGFESAVQFVFDHEGGLNPADSNGSPSNFGINQKAHPGVDVRSLTKEQAAQVYREKYWDQIGGDQLASQNPTLATMAMDTAVMAGVGKSKDLLSKSGGDPGKFLSLREEFLADLQAKNPEKFGKYRDAWASRNNNLRSLQSPVDSDTQLALSMVPPDRLPSFIAHANSEQHRQQAQYRAQMGTVEADHAAMAMTGKQPQTPLTMQNFIQAHGEIEGQQRFEAYQQTQQMGADIARVKTMPVAQMDQLLEGHKPDVSTPGFDMASKRYTVLAHAVDQVKTMRAKDPIQFALSENLGVEPLKLSDPVEMAQGLGQRVGVAQTMTAQYGAPLRLMTNDEAATLTSGFRKMTSDTKLQYIQEINSRVVDPDSFRAVMQQIAPDSPVTAAVGYILNAEHAPVQTTHWMGQDERFSPRDVARLMLEGESRLNPMKADKDEDGKGKFAMPLDKDIQSAFSKEVGAAFRDQPNRYDHALQAAKAYYAGKSARDGDYTGIMNSSRMAEAIKAAVGGVADMNGHGEVVLPWGMDEHVFRLRSEEVFYQQAKASGLTMLPGDFTRYGLQMADEGGKYFVTSGSTLLLDRNRRPVVLDLANTAQHDKAISMKTPATFEYMGTP